MKTSKSDYLLPRIKPIRSEEKVNQSYSQKQRKYPTLKHSISTLKHSIPTLKHSTSNTQSQYNQQRLVSQSMQNNSGISTILKTVRTDYESSTKKVSQLSFFKFTNHNKTIKKQQRTKRLQKKVITPSNFHTLEQQTLNQQQDYDETLSHYNQSFDKKIVVKEVTVQNKPPQRYKTQMVIYQSSLVLFGGIGCQQNLTWAKLSFNPQGLLLPKRQAQKNIIATNTPLYGHTMTQFKNYAYIYGGVNSDILHELFIMDLKAMTIKTSTDAPYRRKYHASTMIGKFMLVHGGIEGNQTKNTMFYYDTENNVWTTINSANLPCLSHHRMIAMGQKTNRRLGDISQSNQIVYIFGGKDEKGECSNKLYKIKIVGQNHHIQCQEVILNELSDPAPQKRYDFCFQSLENGNILLYGGKNDTQITDFDIKNGTFKDLYTFNTVRKSWKKHETNLDYRHSMASISNKGRVYIYGGLVDRKYANANILMIKLGEKMGLNSLKQCDDMCSKQNIPTVESIKRIGDF